MINIEEQIEIRQLPDKQGYLGLLDNGEPVKSIEEIQNEILTETKVLSSIPMWTDGEDWKSKLTDLLAKEQCNFLLHSSAGRVIMENLLDNSYPTLSRSVDIYDIPELLPLLVGNQILERTEDGKVKPLYSDMCEFDIKAKIMQPYCPDFISPTTWSEYLDLLNGFDSKDKTVRKIVQFAIDKGELCSAMIFNLTERASGYRIRMMNWLTKYGVIGKQDKNGFAKTLITTMDEFDEKLKDDNLLTLALRIAFEAHEKQVDKNGKPYILHPLAVASKLDDVELKAAAILHDTIEDTDVTADCLLKQGIPQEVVEIVEVLTKPENISYEDYLKKVKQNSKALKVKLVDLAHNTAPSRADGLNESRRKKYELAKKVLNEKFN